MQTGDQINTWRAMSPIIRAAINIIPASPVAMHAIGTAVDDISFNLCHQMFKLCDQRQMPVNWSINTVTVKLYLIRILVCL